MEDKDIHAGHRQRQIDSFITSPDSLSDHELLEVMLYPVIKRRDTNVIAHRLIITFGSLSGVMTATPQELMAVDGVGKTTASFIAVIGKITSSVKKREEVKSKGGKFSPELITQEIAENFNGLNQELFMVLLLDAKFRIICKIPFTDYQDSLVSANIREVARAIALHKPTFLICAHNHTSGIASPSKEDDFATKQLNMLCAIHGVSLIDHIIFGKNEKYSYHQERRLETIKRQTDLISITENLVSKE